MSFSFKPATRSGVGIFVALAGGSRSGKTYSALRIARGLAGPGGKIAAIDTEARRMSHYAEEFEFDVVNMLPPFSPARFAEAAEQAQAEGYAALVIDSFSLEWNGVGGVLDWADQEVERMAGNDFAKRERVKLASWIAPKKAHKMMRDRLLQLTMPIVFCIRAQEEVEKQGSQIVKVGWKPVQDAALLYEWTVNLTFHPDTPGVIRRDQTHKIQSQHAHLFPDGELVTEAAGAGLREWAHGDQAAADEAAYRKRREAADRLMARFAKAETLVELHEITDDPQVKQWRQKRTLDDAAVAAQVTEAFNARAALLALTDETEPPPFYPDPQREPGDIIPGFDDAPAPRNGTLIEAIRRVAATTHADELDDLTSSPKWKASVKTLADGEKEELATAVNAARRRLATVARNADIAA